MLTSSCWARAGARGRNRPGTGRSRGRIGRGRAGRLRRAQWHRGGGEPRAGHPLRVVDEGVAVVLDGGDDGVAQALEVVDRVFGVPAEDVRQHAQEGGVAVGVAVRLDQEEAVDQHQVGLVRAVEWSLPS